MNFSCLKWRCLILTLQHFWKVLIYLWNKFYKKNIWTNICAEHNFRSLNGTDSIFGKEKGHISSNSGTPPSGHETNARRHSKHSTVIAFQIHLINQFLFFDKSTSSALLRCLFLRVLWSFFIIETCLLRSCVGSSYMTVNYQTTNDSNAFL